MKTSIFAAWLLTCLAAFEITASAATYTDDMTAAVSDNVKRYSGFAAYTMRGSVPDRSVLTFASYAGSSLSAHADYRVEGAETAVVSLYSPCGTFVSQKGSDVYLGVSGGTDGISGQNRQQALLRRGTNEVYTNAGGKGKLYCSDPGLAIFKFNPVSELPAGLIGYGAHIGYSYDGKSFSDAALTHTGLDILQDSLCYERYTAAVPSGAKYIRVEINDVATVPLETGGALQKQGMASRFTMLASVVISGGSLSMGEPEAQVALPSAEYYMGKEAASKSAEAGKIPETAGESGSSGNKNSSSSKFEGTITSSSKAGREKEKKQSDAPKSGGKEEKSSSSSTSAEDVRDETVVYQIRRDENGGLLDGAVTVYIIIVSGVLVLLVLLKRRQG